MTNGVFFETEGKTMDKKPFNYRSFTAFIVTWAFVVATITGTVLYIVPQGRIANWVDWRLLGLLKEDWGNIHLVFAAIFIAGGVLHLYYNWKPFKKYLAERVSGHLHPKKELLLSLVVSLLLVVGAIFQVPPFNYYFQLNEWAKEAWVTGPEVEPPFGHAEELSLAGFARRQNMDLDKVTDELRRQNLAFSSPSQSLANIAHANGLSAMQLYDLIRQFEKRNKAVSGTVHTVATVDATFGGTGVGRKTLAVIGETLGLSEEMVAEKLARAGVEGKADETLKEIAGRYGFKPIDLVKIIVIKGYRPELLAE